MQVKRHAKWSRSIFLKNKKWLTVVRGPFQKYGLPNLGPACTGGGPGPAPPPSPPPWGACTSMAGRWRNVAAGASQGDITIVAQAMDTCNWVGVNSIQDWYRALAVWVERWD